MLFRRLCFPLVLAFALGRFASAGPVTPIDDCAARLSRQFATSPGLKKGYLFSAYRFPAESELVRRWSRLHPALKARFSSLRLTGPQDLHVTLVHFGQWQPERLPEIAQHALPRLNEELKARGKLVVMGKDHQIIALELDLGDSSLGSAVVEAISTLVQLGLRTPGKYDGQFRAHITLAQTRRPKEGSPPPVPPAVFTEFQAALSSSPDSAIEGLPMIFSPDHQPELLLAGSARPPGYPAEYISVEAYTQFLDSQSSLK